MPRCPSASVIITEATLSFLGLGVKHPLATWGNMINSVTGSSESMLKYTYIWVPVGLLIASPSWPSTSSATVSETPSTRR